MRRFLFWLTDRLPCRIIDEAGKPYLERYYLCSLGSTRVYLHRFVGSDPDRGLHSHPWSWALSLVLSGWYFEERFSGTERPVLRRVRWFNFLMGESFHRVVMPTDWCLSPAECPMNIRPTVRQAMAVTECWTLFIHKAVEGGRRWGFMRPAPLPRVINRKGEVAVEAVRDRLVFTPFTYPGGKTTSGQWWKTVPKGRAEPRRRSANA